MTASRSDSGAASTTGLKTRLTLYPNVRHTIRAGMEYTYHTFLPTEFYATSNNVDFDLGEAVRTRSHELALYVEDEFDVSDALRINADFGGAASSRRPLSPAMFRPKRATH